MKGDKTMKDKQMTVRQFFQGSTNWIKIRIYDSLGNPVYIHDEEELNYIANCEIEAVEGNNIYIAL